MQPQQPIITPSGKVSINPFVHIFRGCRNLFATNPLPAIFASLISAILGFGLGFLFIVLILSSIKGLYGGSGSASSFFIGLFVKILAFWLLSSLVNGYFWEVVLRTVLTGTRREHVSFGSLFTFVAKRYLLAVLVALMFSGVFIGVGAAVIGAAFIHPALAILVGIIGFIFLLIFILRMSYVFFITVDDERPQSARWVLKRSSTLWQKSGGAIVTYYLLLVAISVLFSVLTNSHSAGNSTPIHNNPPSSAPTFNAHSAVAYGALLIYAVFEGIFLLVLNAAVGHIYNQAKQIVDGHQTPMPPAAQTHSSQAALPPTPFTPLNSSPSPQVTPQTIEPQVIADNDKPSSPVA